MKSIVAIKYEILNKSFLSNKDIQVLMGVGATKASRLRQKLIKSQKDNGYRLPLNNNLPTKLFIQFYNVDTETILKNYRMERELDAKKQS